MILTGKTKADFLKENKWVEELLFHEVDEIYINALIIDWFDSVGIYVFIERAMYLEVPNFIYRIETEDNLHEGYRESKRKEATQQAIIKANEIYNLKFGE